MALLNYLANVCLLIFHPIALTRFEYFLSLVPTEYIDYSGMFTRVQWANQFAVTQFRHELEENTHRMPGLFFKYDIEPIMVKISAKRPALSHTLVRLCGMIGGLYATMGIFVSIINAVIRPSGYKKGMD
jgi:hypothetical protein